MRSLAKVSQYYRIILECYEKSGDLENLISKENLLEGQIEAPKDIFNFGLGHKKQIELIQLAQDKLLQKQCELISADAKCPYCEVKLAKNGKKVSVFHDVFTDHKLNLNRRKCAKCGYETGASIKSIMGNSLSADLMKLQSELGAHL